MSPRGGRRPNQTGRPLRGAEPVTTRATVGLTASERAELTAALRPGESLAGLLRDGGVQLARHRGNPFKNPAGCTCEGHRHAGGRGGCYVGGSITKPCPCAWFD